MALVTDVMWVLLKTIATTTSIALAKTHLSNSAEFVNKLQENSFRQKFVKNTE